MGRTSKKRRRVSEQTFPTNWWDLPFEMREMVIDRMDPKTRGNFAQCSTICEKEVKMSKFYLNAIRIDRTLHRQLYIGYDSADHQCCLEFVEIPDLSIPQTIVVYKTTAPKSEIETQRVMKWMKTEDGNPEDVRKRYVKEILEKNRKNIAAFQVDDNKFSMVDLDIKGLCNLEYLTHNLEDLIAIGSINVEHIYRMDTVYLACTDIKFEEVLNFEGYSYLIRSDDFDEENTKKYLKMWKNDEICETVRTVTVMSNKFSNFEKQKITDGLDAFDYEEVDGECRFRFHLTHDNDKQWYTDVKLDGMFLTITLMGKCYCDQ